MKPLRAMLGGAMLACALGLKLPALDAAEKADDRSRLPAAAREELRQWIKARSSRHIVYTDAGLDEASRIIGEIDMLRAGAQSFFGRTIPETSPVLIVLPTKMSEAWKAIAATGDGPKVAVHAPAGKMVELYVVNYDWQTEGLEPLFSAMGQALVERVNLRGPFWFRRGVGKFLGSIAFANGGVTMGEMKTKLSVEGWRPWPEFFSLAENNPDLSAPAPNSAHWESQAVAFTRFALTDRDPAALDRLLQWAALLQAGGEPTEEAFRTIFGQSWEAWEKRMTGFVAAGANPRFAFRGNMMRSVATKVNMPPSEMGDLYVLAQILIRHEPASEAALEHLLKDGMKTEQFRVLLAEACLKWQKSEAAEAQVRELVDRRIPNASVYTYMAEQLFNRHVPAVTLQSALPSGEVVTEIKALCDAAFASAPYDGRANDLMAWADALSPNVSAAQVTAVESLYEAVYGHFSTSNISCALMVAQWRSGDKAAARATARVLLDSPYADKTAKRLAGEVMKESGS